MMTSYLHTICPRKKLSRQISLSSMIDADWTIGRERADVAGKILADALLNREQVISTRGGTPGRRW